MPNECKMWDKAQCKMYDATNTSGANFKGYTLNLAAWPPAGLPGFQPGCLGVGLGPAGGRSSGRPPPHKKDMTRKMKDAGRKKEMCGAWRGVQGGVKCNMYDAGGTPY